MDLAIYIENEKDFRQFQNIAFDLGYQWRDSGFNVFDTSKFPLYVYLYLDKHTEKKFIIFHNGYHHNQLTYKQFKRKTIILCIK